MSEAALQSALKRRSAAPSIMRALSIAFTIFIVVRQMNRLKRRTEPAAPTTRECPYCLSAIAIKAIRCPHCTSELETRRPS